MAPETIPTIQKKEPPPPGTLPRNAQTWFIGGVAVVMVLVIALSGGRTKTRTSDSERTPAAKTTNTSEARIAEYRERID